MSFEGPSLERLHAEKIHEKAESVIDIHRIKEEDFLDPYGEQTVTSDLEEVRRLEEEVFPEDATAESEAQKKVADIFEAIVLEHGELSDWFGENATTIKTSKFDDYKNGVDMVIEFRGKEPRSASFLGLAADVTFTADTTKKFDKLLTQIEDGVLPKVKYFHSEYMDIHGQLGRLPEVIIGASKKTVMELAEAWISKENRVLARHKIQVMILRQMQMQLETFAQCATTAGRDDIATLYKERLDVIKEILRTKQEIEMEVGHTLEDDHVHADIMSYMRRLKQLTVDK